VASVAEVFSVGAVVGIVVLTVGSAGVSFLETLKISMPQKISTATAMIKRTGSFAAFLGGLRRGFSTENTSLLKLYGYFTPFFAVTQVPNLYIGGILR
jgi:hypothetical protein